MAFIFEKLDVYNRAVDFADKICGLTKDFVKGNYYLADQLNRASLSISTNIAEGNGRYHKADRANFWQRRLSLVLLEGYSKDSKNHSFIRNIMKQLENDKEYYVKKAVEWTKRNLAKYKGTC